MKGMIPKARPLSRLCRCLPIHTLPNNASTPAHPISRLLAGGGTWPALAAQLEASGPLPPALVDQVILDLNHPLHAKQALLFFHCSSRHPLPSRHSLRSYSLAAHLLARAGLLADARALLDSAVRHHTGSSVVDALLATYEVAHSTPQVFDLLIRTYSKLRMVDEAFHACKRSGDHGFALGLTSFNSLLRIAHKTGCVEVAWKVYEYMIVRRVYPNQDTVETMIGLMCKEGTLKKMVAVLDRISEKRCGPGVIVNTALALRLVAERRRVEDVAMMLKRMLQKNMILDFVAYSLIVHGHCTTGRLDLANEARNEMTNRGCSSNAFVYTSFIHAHCEKGEIEEACRLLEEMLLKGLQPYDVTYSLLVEACSRTGRMEESLRFYETMIKEGFLPDCAAFNEMMGVLCEAGEVERANGLLTLLMDKGFHPNEFTYLKLINGFGKKGKSQEIIKLHFEMEHSGINPSMAVYTSLIQNLCQCGKLKEAEKILTVMRRRPSASSSSIYDALISGYCEKGDTKRALDFYDEMMKENLKPGACTFMKLVKKIILAETIYCRSLVHKILQIVIK